MKIGFTELVVVFLVALFVIGPDNLPAYARKLGEALAEFRKYSESATKDIRESIVEPLEEAQRPLKEAMQPITDTEKEIRSNVKDIQKSLADIGKEKKPAVEKETVNENAQESENGAEQTAVQTDDKTEGSIENENRNDGIITDSSGSSDNIRANTDSKAD